jgi:putative hemolysin
MSPPSFSGLLAVGGGTPVVPTDPLPTAAMFVGLFAASFFFSGSETAFFSLQERERRRIEEGDSLTDQRIHSMLQRRTSLITTILVGNETANVLISATAAGLFAVFAPDKPWLTVLVVTPALVLLSEITPKVLAYRYNVWWASLAVWPLTALYFAVTPVRWVIDALVKLIAWALHTPLSEKNAQLGAAEFLVLVEQSTHQGVVHADARDIIEAVFELDDVPVSRVMTPRPDIFSLSIDTPWPRLVAACQEARYSRVPVWEDHPDNIIGVLLTKDLLRHRRQPPSSKDALRELLVPPMFVPATRAVSEMMREMITRRVHIGFVADEHGTLMGIVSLDDLIVELVGEIGDNDDAPPPPEIEVSERGWVVQGWLDVDDFAEHTEVSLPSGGWHTVAGFVFHTLGRIPREGDAFDADNHRFTVQKMDGRRVAVVRVEPVTADDAAVENAP